MNVVAAILCGNKSKESKVEPSRVLPPFDSTIALKMPADALKLAQPIKINGTLDGMLSLMTSLREEKVALLYSYPILKFEL